MIIYVINFTVFNNIENSQFIFNHIFSSERKKEEIVNMIKQYKEAEYGELTEFCMYISSEELRNSQYKIYEYNEFIKARNMTLSSLTSISAPDRI